MCEKKIQKYEYENQYDDCVESHLARLADSEATHSIVKPLDNPAGSNLELKEGAACSRHCVSPCFLRR